ncbi:MAG: hypothetical protein Q8J78_04905 [Moraxellaceae bacterium]|nr:hypothetical protein [Moraxellaceae bacterium]
MSAAPAFSAAETVAKNPPVVNRANGGEVVGTFMDGEGFAIAVPKGEPSRVITGPFIHVIGASVSLLKGGDRVLLLRTAEGRVKCLVPANIACGIFCVTNPRVDPPTRVDPRRRAASAL